MVGTRLSQSARAAYWGRTCLVWSGLALAGNMAYSDESKVVEEKAVAASTEKAVDQPENKPGESKPAEEKKDVENPEEANTAEPKPAVVAGPAVIFAKTEGTETPEDAAQRKAVEEALLHFAAAFNGHKAKEVSELYTINAELINQAGKVTRGRPAIEEVLSKLFEIQPTVQIQMEVESIRFLSPELAIEEGVSVMTSGTEQEGLMVHRDRYTVTHVKHEGKWLMAIARDWAPAPLTAQEQLQQLDWLVGEWVDENSDTTVHTTYHWSQDKRYLLSRYAVQREGQAPVEGMQRVGWDPQLQQLHSWSFDSIGGFSEGLWSRSGDQWIIKRTGTNSEGKVRSATNILTRLGPDHATFQSRDRAIGSEMQPDLAPVPIVRKAPEPSLPKAVERAADKSSSKPTESK